MAGRSDSRARVLAAIESATTPSRRDGDVEVPLGRKAARTRAALLEAAGVQFAENGYGATSVGDIAAAAGVSLGAFYQYFRDRADVMAAIVGEGAQRMLEDAEHRWRPDDGRDGVRKMLHAFVVHYRLTAKFQRVWEEVTHVEPELAELKREINRIFYAGTEDAIRSGQRKGLIRAELDPESTAIALSAMTDRTCYVRFVFDGGQSVSDDAIVDTLTDVWCQTLGMA
ncbi:MAG TPA: TetR/AcrR family transcriptional regulator [Acidimicrobiales bacterium]|nr:TetR/AcrR family transcriptional regulator [Acidimicrobiales bacterium]